jgi:hypothetical protein
MARKKLALAPDLTIAQLSKLDGRGGSCECYLLTVSLPSPLRLKHTLDGRRVVQATEGGASAYRVALPVKPVVGAIAAHARLFVIGTTFELAGKSRASTARSNSSSASRSTPSYSAAVASLHLASPTGRLS